MSKIVSPEFKFKILCEIFKYSVTNLKSAAIGKLKKFKTVNN